MTLAIKNASEVLELGFDELWNQIQILKEQKEIDNLTYEKIKNGINIKYPIYYIIQEWYEVYPSSKKAKVLGYNKIPLEDFMEEKEKREAIMRKIIIEQIEEGPTIPRI